MKVLFISKRYEDEDELSLLKDSKQSISVAHHKLQNCIIESLESSSEEVYCMNIFPMGNFPLLCKKFVYHSRIVDAKHEYIGSVNFPFVKELEREIKITRQIRSWINKNKDCEKVIFLYDLYLPSLKSALKFHDEGIKIFAYIPDLPGKLCVDYQRNRSLVKLYRDLQSSQLLKRVNMLDGAILITKYMAEPLNLVIPYIIIEGMVKTTLDNSKARAFSDGTTKILYAGELSENVGVKNLLDAFMMTNNKRIELHICGHGDMESSIDAATKLDERIKFHGFLPMTEMEKLEQSIDIYINPRQNNNLFVKYSFPSKNLEYLKTGKPFIGYKLYGVTDDYDEYIYYPSDDTVESLRDKIVEVVNETVANKLHDYEKQKEFIYKNKSVNSRGKEIIQFIKDVQQ